MNDTNSATKSLPHDPDVTRTRSLLIWSQTRYHCATGPISIPLRLNVVQERVVTKTVPFTLMKFGAYMSYNICSYSLVVYVGIAILWVLLFSSKIKEVQKYGLYALDIYNDARIIASINFHFEYQTYSNRNTDTRTCRYM